MYNFLKPIFYIICKIFFRVEVVGRENLIDENFILVANHKSAWDPILISVNFKPQIHWMAKKELFNNSLFAKFIKSLGAFVIDRDQADIKGIKTAMRKIKEKKVIGIFPQGTRCKVYDDSIIKSGTALIAHRTKTKVLPVFIDGDYKIFKKTYLRIRPVFEIPDKKFNNEEYTMISRNIMNRVYGLGEENKNILS